MVRGVGSSNTPRLSAGIVRSFAICKMTTTSATQSLNPTVKVEPRGASALNLGAPFSRKWRATMIVAAAGEGALIPIIIWGIPVGPDLNNHYRFAVAFHDSIRGGNLYPGWMDASNFGYGDPRLRFYPPGLYYLMSAARALTGWYSASILTFCFFSIVGGLGVYYWSRSLCSTR